MTTADLVISFSGGKDSSAMLHLLVSRYAASRQVYIDSPFPSLSGKAQTIEEMLCLLTTQIACLQVAVVAMAAGQHRLEEDPRLSLLTESIDTSSVPKHWGPVAPTFWKLFRQTSRKCGSR